MRQKNNRMTTLAKILATIAYTLNVLVFTTFLWKWYGEYTAVNSFICLAIIIVIPFIFRAFGMLLQKYFKIKL